MIGVKRAPIRIDESTMLSKTSMQKHFKDTSPLLKESTRYKKKKKSALGDFTLHFFQMPNQDGLAGNLVQFFNLKSVPTSVDESSSSTESAETGLAKNESTRDRDERFEFGDDNYAGMDLGKTTFFSFFSFYFI